MPGQPAAAITSTKETEQSRILARADYRTLWTPTITWGFSPGLSFGCVRVPRKIAWWHRREDSFWLPLPYSRVIFLPCSVPWPKRSRGLL